MDVLRISRHVALDDDDPKRRTKLHNPSMTFKPWIESRRRWENGWSRRAKPRQPRHPQRGDAESGLAQRNLVRECVMLST